MTTTTELELNLSEEGSDVIPGHVYLAISHDGIFFPGCSDTVYGNFYVFYFITTNGDLPVRSLRWRFITLINVNNKLHRTYNSRARRFKSFAEYVGWKWALRNGQRIRTWFCRSKIGQDTARGQPESDLYKPRSFILSNGRELKKINNFFLLFYFIEKH